MKRNLKLSALLLAFLILLNGCGIIDKNNSTDRTADPLAGTNPVSKNEFNAEVITAGDGLLVTPDKDSNEYKSSDKISVGINNARISDKEGKEITLRDLNVGDIVKVTYDGIIAESYPAQITASAIEVIGHNLLIDGYLALIDDIYQEDNGLNGDITMIALDTAAWVGLTDLEKEIIFTKMKEIYSVDIIEGNFDKLSEQGLIDKEQLYFPSGILITIKDIKYDEKDQKITCAISKWRSGDGAIGSDDATAKYKDGEWKIEKEGMWIS